jgi:hypothetical protein
LVFAAEPDFAAVGSAVSDRHVRGYKHNRRPVWLLDVWQPRGKLAFRRAPFCDPAATGFRMDLEAVDADSRGFLAKLQLLREAIGQRTADPELGNLHLALAVAKAARQFTFFFAADDDETDMGCQTVAGSLVSFGGRIDRLAVQYSEGRTTVTPLSFLEDDDEEDLRKLIARASRVAGVSFLPPRDIEGGQTLYENPVAQWPTDAGDPAEILGFGTWDPLLNIERDFAVVFERL